MSMCTSADCKLCEFLSSKEDLETSFNRVETQKAKCKSEKKESVANSARMVHVR